MNDNIFFGGYLKYLTENAVFQALKMEISDNKLPIEVYLLLSEAWQSRFWVTKGFDGKTGIKDKYAPRLASFLHDYMSRTGRGGKVSDVIFKWLEIKTGTNKVSANIQFGLVRVGSQYFILRDLIRKKRKKPTKKMLNLYKSIT